MYNNELIAKKITSTVENNIGNIARFVGRKIKDFTEKSKIDLKISFIDYLEEAFDKHSRIKTILYKNQPKYLYDFFECSNLSLDHQSINCENVRNIMKISHFNIIVGMGGMGKSTLMKHFFLNSIDNNDLIPLFIELKGFDGSTNLVEYCYNVIRNLKFKADVKYFEYALESGSFILFLDGFDEIVDDVKPMFSKALFEFCDKYSANYFFVSSRSCDTFIGWSRFTKFETKPFSETQAEALIEKIDYDISIKTRFIEELKNGLYLKHKSFASNPLLLNILLLTFDNYAEIPDKLHIFYSQAFNTMYSVHDATKPEGFKRALKSFLPYDYFKKVFANFCFRTYIQEKTEFSNDEILGLIDKSGSFLDKFSPEDYLYDLQNAVCLIYLDGLNYVFTHRSFQEYFSALYLVNLDDNSQKIVCQSMISRNLISIYSDSVFSMLRDMNEERFNKNVILPVLKEMKNNMFHFIDNVHSFYFHIVENIEFVSIKSPEHLSFKHNHNPSRTIVFRDRGVFTVVTFNEKISHNFVLFLLEKYGITTIGSQNLSRLFSDFLNIKIDIDLLRKDNSLFNNIIAQTYIGRIIKKISELYDSISKQQELAEIELKSILDL